MTTSTVPLPTTEVESCKYVMEFYDGSKIFDANSPEALYTKVCNSTFANFNLEKMKLDIEDTGEFKYCNGIYTIKKVPYAAS